MDRALVAVLGGAVGCGALLALAVLKNERTFTARLYADSAAVTHTSLTRGLDRSPPAPSAPEPMASPAPVLSHPSAHAPARSGAGPTLPVPAARR